MVFARIAQAAAYAPNKWLQTMICLKSWTPAMNGFHHVRELEDDISLEMKQLVI